MWYMLSTQEERPNKFYTGNLEFDPDSLGFVWWEKKDGYFLIDTSIPGNFNTGHVFDDMPGAPGVIGPRLSSAERMAIIEYMKVLEYSGRDLECGSLYEHYVNLYYSEPYYAYKFSSPKEMMEYYTSKQYTSNTGYTQ